MEYQEHFKEHYADWLSRMSVSSLVKYEDNLSQIIDSDLFFDCILSDEILMLHQLIRNECVVRLSVISVDND